MDHERIRREAERRYQSEGEPIAQPDSGRRSPSGSHDDRDDLIEELRIHQIELEIQNEELQRSQREAEEARQRYYALYEYAPVGYVTVRPDGRILSANLTICELAQKSRQAVTRGGLFGLVHQDDRAPVVSLLRHVVAEEGERTSAEVRLSGESGRTVQMEAVRHDGGEATPQEIQLCFTDVRGQKQAEKRARDAAEHNHLLLRELNHRVKNNLQLLLSVVTLQRNRADDVAVSDALGAVEDRIRALTFSHDTLKPTSMSGGADLVELVSTLAKQFRAHHDVQIDFTPAMEKLVVDGDTALSLALIVNEIVANSLKHAGLDRPDDLITIRLENGARSGNDGRAVRLRIADTGRGLPDHLLEDTASGGLGFMLVGQLAEQQLGGTWTRRNPPDGGAEHTIQVTL